LGKVAEPANTASTKRTDNRGLAKAAGIVMVAMLISRILGFVRDLAMTSQFGRSYITDAYIAAFTIPDLIYDLLVGGALSSAFIPVFSSYLAQGKEDEGWEVASTVVNIVIVGLCIGIGLGFYFTPSLISLVASKFDGERLDLTVKLSRIMLPSVLFTGLNGIMLGILNSYKQFAYPAIGAVIYNVGIIAMGLLLGPHIGIAGFSIGVVVGVIGSFLIQISSLFFLRKMKYRPVLNLGHPGIKKLGSLAIASIIGLSIGQINFIVNQNLASGLSLGSITALRMANRIMWVPIGIFAHSIGVTIFPTLVSNVATKRIKEFKENFSYGLRLILFIIIPASVGLMTFGEPIVRLLFEQGQFHRSDTIATAEVLFFYSIGMFAQSAISIVTRGFYAFHDTRTPIKVGLVMIAVNYTFSHLFIVYLGAKGLALSYSLTGFLNLSALFFLLRLKVGSMGINKIAVSALKTLVASLAMGACTYFMTQFYESLILVNQKSAQLVEVILIVGISAIIYLILTKALRMEEADIVMNNFLARFKGTPFAAIAGLKDKRHRRKVD
jgi:putative peptidoglycan lipid II flippase